MDRIRASRDVRRMADIRKVVGANLRRLRLARGLTQEALAHDADIAPSFLSQIENGLRSPTVTTLDALAKVMKASIVEFFVTLDAPVKGLPRGRRTK